MLPGCFFNSFISAVAGSRSVFFGGVSGAGPFTGAGTVELDGDLRPGNSPASVSFGRDLELGYSARLYAEIGGTTPGTQYDHIQVTGHLSLDGTLQASLINGFAPTAGQSFDIMDWGSRSGTFSTLLLPTLNGGLVWDSSQLYTTGVIRVAAASLAVDYNQNGVVDAADYVVWRKALGTAYTQADYNVWRTHFGQSAGSGAALPSAKPLSAAVPEPATLVMLLVGALAMCTRRGREVS